MMPFEPADDADDSLLAAINTTPLVDVMLVLLIIFLITIPVAIQTVPVRLPRETNQLTQTVRGTVTIAVTADGRLHWNAEALGDDARLVERLKAIAIQDPQPEIHVRGDADAAFERVGRVLSDCQRAGIVKVSFIIDPQAGGG